QRLIFVRQHHVHVHRRAVLYHQLLRAMPLFSPKTHTHPITLGRNRRKLEFPSRGGRRLELPRAGHEDHRRPFDRRIPRLTHTTPPSLSLPIEVARTAPKVGSTTAVYKCGQENS